MIEKFDAILDILKYLIRLEETHKREEDKYDTLHGIATNAFTKKQRDPRVAELLEGMVINGLIEKTKLKDRVFFRVTEKGKEIYKNHLKFASGIISSIVQKELREEMVPE